MSESNFKLISHVLCPYVQRSVILLLEKEEMYTRTDIDLDNPPDWFLSLSPMGRVPALSIENNDTKKPTALFESAVICEYINEVTTGSLHPSDPLLKAYHRSWIEFGSEVLNNIGSLYNAQDKKEFENKSYDIKNMFALIEKELGNGPYFSGEQFHIIDAVFGPIFRYFETFDRIVKLDTFSETPKVGIWRNALRQRPSIKNAVSTEYPELLLLFLKNRKSYISSLIL